MTGFKDWAVYSRFPGRKGFFELEEQLEYHTMSGSVYKVPQGFITDLGSIPQLFWNLIPRDAYPSAFILHDYFCEDSWIDRKDGDYLLYEALRLSGCPLWKAKVIYWAVRAYAILTFKK